MNGETLSHDVKAKVIYTESQYADEVLRGIRLIMSGLGMIASAWARRYALDKIVYKKNGAGKTAQG